MDDKSDVTAVYRAPLVSGVGLRFLLVKVYNNYYSLLPRPFCVILGACAGGEGRGQNGLENNYILARAKARMWKNDC